MRAELMEIERIENYLLNEMTASEKSDFENEMDTDPNLKKKVEAQKLLADGVKRMALKGSAKKATKTYKLGKFLSIAIPLVIVVAGAIAASIYFSGNDTGITTQSQEHIENIQFPENDSLSADANHYLDQEIFRLDTDRDTVIETKDGLVLYIPKGAFDEDDVDLMVQTALNPEDILYAGLSTESNGVPLETGGMFYVDAFKNGERIELKKPITADVPANEKKPGMQLFEGEKDENGEINWVNPKEIQNDLTPVDITTLDFYPPNYENSLENWGYSGEAFFDSLYYSFACECGEDVNIDVSPYSVDWQTLVSKGEDKRGSLLKSGDYYDLYLRIVGMRKELSNNTDEDIGSKIDSYYTEQERTSNKEKALPPTTKWNIYGKRVEENIIDIIFDVDQLNDSYIYSTDMINGSMSMPTMFLFQTVEGEFEKIGNIRESGTKVFNVEPNFNWDGRKDQVKFSPGNNVRFVQRIKTKTDKVSMKVNYAYMTAAYGITTFDPQEDSVLVTIQKSGSRTGNVTDSENGDDSIAFDLPYVPSEACPGIDPATIKTIRNKKFNNTNLATKEFEERMPWIHKSCENSILELYISNLDKPLSEIDKMVVNRTYGDVKAKFEYFASRNDGKVNTSDRAIQKLSDYFNRKQKAIREALVKTQNDFRNEQTELDQKSFEKESKSGMRAVENKTEVFQKEFTKNLCKTYDELDIDKDCNPQQRPVTQSRSGYTLTIPNTGWWNVDMYVNKATQDRETTTIQKNGKSTTIVYNEWSAKIDKQDRYDRINVYNIPKEFNSYVKLNPEGEKYVYKLNAEINYQTVVLAWDEEKIYFDLSDAKSGDHMIQLNAISKKEFRKMVRKKLKSINNMSEELDYVEYMQKDQKRNNDNKARKDLRAKIRPVVFPCGEWDPAVVEENQGVPNGSNNLRIDSNGDIIRR